MFFPGNERREIAQAAGRLIALDSNKEINAVVIESNSANLISSSDNNLINWLRLRLSWEKSASSDPPIKKSRSTSSINASLAIQLSIRLRLN